MLTIAGYKYVCHKIVPRPWGAECRFTVSKDGRIIDDIVILRDGKEDDKQMEILISSRLAATDGAKIVQPEPSRMWAEDEIKSLLVEKGYLTVEESLSDLKTKSELIEDAR